MVELDDSPRTSNGDEVLGSAEGLIPIFGKTWLTIIGPLLSVTVLFAKRAKVQYSRSILERVNSEDNTKIIHIN